MRIPSPDEILFRLRQQAWNAKDRIVRRFTGNHALFPENAALQSQYFFSSLRSIETTLSFYNTTVGAPWKNATILAADRICSERFDLLGYRGLPFPLSDGKTAWHLDAVSSRTAPLSWWQSVPYLDHSVVGDAKVAWELNRHQFMIVLAKAYCLTNDDRYRSTFFLLMSSWWENNPSKYGINWCSSLELAFRSIAWVWTFLIFGGTERFEPNFMHRCIQSLAEHAEHVHHNMSAYFSPNTHLTGEALGLYYVGTLLPDLEHAALWREHGRKTLLDCLDIHVLPDGGYMERSLWYHRYTIDIYLHFFLLAGTAGDVLPSIVAEKLLQMSNLLYHSATPDRRIPFIGDDDGGRLLPLDNLAHDDLRGLFSTLAVVFQREDYAWFAGLFQEETLWLCGNAAPEKFAQLVPTDPNITSKGYPDTGMYFMRSGWSPDDTYMGFDCGEHGWLNCGHAHADLLGLQLYVGDEAIIVDPGTCSYVTDDRNYFRSASAHSVLTVNGEGSASPKGLFHWNRIDQHQMLVWETGPDIDVCAGAHIYSSGVVHLRELFFIKPKLVVLVDTILGTGVHLIRSQFHLGSVEWQLNGLQAWRTGGGKHMEILFACPESIKVRLDTAYRSASYGIKQPSLMLIGEGNAVLSVRMATVVNLSGMSANVLRVGEGLDVGFCVSISGKDCFEYRESEAISSYVRNMRNI